MPGRGPPAEMLEALAVVSGNVDGGVQGEAVHFRAQWQRRESRSARTARTEPSEPRARIRALGHPALDRGCLEEEEAPAEATLSPCGESAT